MHRFTSGEWNRADGKPGRVVWYQYWDTYLDHVGSFFARLFDTVLPSLFLSIQSDESRHMANGYATLAACLSDDRNLEFLQQDLEEALWRGHRFVDTLHLQPVKFPDYNTVYASLKTRQIDAWVAPSQQASGRGTS